MQSTTLKPKIVRAGEGRTWGAPDGKITTMLSSADCGEQFFVFHSETQPGGGPPPHVHTREDEVFLILEGEFEFLVGDTIVSAGPGDTVFGPRDVPHTFKNVGTTVGKAFTIATGSNFEAFHPKFCDILNGPNPSFEAMKSLAEEHGIYFVETAG
jgi:mannose-6-phosphate isomerase-like protein (cupin superfamily)